VPHFLYSSVEGEGKWEEESGVGGDREKSKMSGN